MLNAETETHQGDIDPGKVDVRLRYVLSMHLDPVDGSPYWLDRQRILGFDIRREICEASQLARFGAMQPSDLAQRPLFDFIPRALHGQRRNLILAQTGGATGNPVWTAYSKKEFYAAFVEPFLVAAKHVGFPRGGNWLYAGPSGPHIIGRAARQLAREFGCGEPFTVDLDPRWVRKMPEGSFGQQRYLHHVVEQVMAIVALQPIDVLFTTPPLLSAIAEQMTDAQRLQIRGVHYGGMHLSAQSLADFQTRWFPNAIHLSGYGNSLFGCCLELDVSARRIPSYFPYGDRLLFAPLGDDACGGSVKRRLSFTRLDETMLLINMAERDEAEFVGPPSDAPGGFCHLGVRDVGPIGGANRPSTGLY